MWGNDPEFARSVTGRGPNNEPLRETWINPQSPRYAAASLGWGGRLSGPIDVAQRHNVLLANGTLMPKLQASSCFSCHGTAQSPFVANLYPSPNRSFPPEGALFPMYVPGSEEWSRWYQSRPGSVAQNPSPGTSALDYDMLIMFAIGAFDAAAGADTYLQGRPRLH
jgi:hypothetical protein